MKRCICAFAVLLIALAFSSCTNTGSTESLASTELTEILTEYKYTVTLHGRLPNAERDSVIVIRTNDESITFDYVAERILDSRYTGALTPEFSIVSIETIE